jgi:hypothetical protein
VRFAVILLAGVVAVGCHKPDLTIDSGPLRVDLARTGVPGGSLRLAPWRMMNRGSARARPTVGGIRVSYHLSTDAIVTRADRALTGLAGPELDELGPGQSHEFPGDPQIGLPVDLQPGTYYFGVILDSRDAVEESDETNNVMSVRIGVVRTPT